MSLEKGKIRYYTEREIRKKGKQDGRDWDWVIWPFKKKYNPDSAQPQINEEELTEFEDNLIKKAQENLNRLDQEWVEIDKNLHTRCSQAEDRYKNAREKYEKVRVSEDTIEEYDDAKNHFNEQPKSHLSSHVGLLLVIIIAVGEGFFNSIVFNIFGQSRLETLLMAISVILTIPLVGWFVGKNLKLKTKPEMTATMMEILVITVIVGLAAIAVIRGVFLEAMEVQEVIRIKLSPVAMGVCFFAINLLLFGTIVAVEYEKALENPDEYNKAKKIFEDATMKLEKERAEVEAAIKEFEEAQKEFREAHCSRTSEFEKIKAKAEEEENKWRGAIQTYRDANMCARMNKTKPKAFTAESDGKLIKISIPGRLESDIKCAKCAYPELSGEEEKKV